MLLKRIQTVILTAVAAACLLGNASLLPAAEIVVLKSSAIKPYNDVLEGFKSTCRCSVQELNLADTGEKNIQGRINSIRPDGVLAIGMDALSSVAKLENLPIFYAMVTEFGSGSSTGMQKLSGVSMDVQPETYLNNMTGLFPDTKRIGLLYNKQNTGRFVKEALAVSHTKGVEIVAREVSNSGEVPEAIASLKGEIDLFWMLPDITVVTPQTIDTILLFSFQNKVPVFSFSNKYVKMGALASLSADPFGLGTQAGELVAKRLDHGDHENHVHMHPQKVHLSINRKVAEKFGLRDIGALIRKADEVY